MSFLSFSSKTFFELSQIYCLRIDFAFVWDFLYPAHFQRNFVQFSRYYRCRVTTFILYHVSWALTSYFTCPSSFSNDSFIILSSFCSLDKLFAWLPASASRLPQTACITLQTLNQRKIKCSIKKMKHICKAEIERFEPSRRYKPTYTLSRGASSATWVNLQWA